MADPAGSVSVEAGSNIVTGYLTSFVAAELDQIVIRGVVGVVSRAVSPSRIELRKPWRGPTLFGDLEWDLLPTGPYWNSSVTTNKRLSDLLTKFEAGPVKFDAAGTLAQRANYDDQGAGFVYLSVDAPFTLYVKLLNTGQASDWSNGQIIGPVGQQYQFSAAQILAGLTTARTSMPELPANDAEIPPGGGWYRNGGGFMYIEPQA